MKTFFLEAPRKAEIVERPIPSYGPGDALIKIKAAGICGSDIGAYKGVNPTVLYPLVLGHEAVGEIISLGSETRDFRIGDRVVIEPYIYCGSCYSCGLGRTNNCEILSVLGVHRDGAMSEFIAHPVKLLHKVPADISVAHLTLAEPLTIALHAIHRSKLAQGECVVISGAGAIGLLAAQVAVLLGATPILIDPVKQRLEMAQRLGIRHVINPIGDDVPLQIMAVTKGRLAEACIEASGAEDSIKKLVDYVAFSGRIVMVGWPKAEVTLRTAMFIRKELEIYGSRNSAGGFPKAIRLIVERSVTVEHLITKIVAFDELPQALSDQADHPEAYLKIVATLS